MSLFGGEEALNFQLKPDSSFNFTCQRCCACCYHRRIELNEYEIAKLSLYLGLKQPDFVSRYLNPDIQPWIKNREDGGCIFLGGSGCQVYPVRPLVCRLYPLGLLLTPKNEEKWGLMPLHPDCLGLITAEGTLTTYLESQGALSYLDFERLRRVAK